MIKKIYFLSLVMSTSLLSAIPISEITDSTKEKIQMIHSKLELIHGSLTEEYPEQLMTTMYLSSDAKVLELGGNVGRNSCVIASILQDSRNLVTIESCKEYAKDLQENRDHNGLNFHIEASAVSKVPLIQEGWTTIVSEVDLPGYVRVNTITFDEVQSKYGIIFDTIVADCEGAFYYILRDDPEILRNIKLIIVENDYVNDEHFKFTADLFTKYGFELVYESAYFERTNFYQVWKR